MLLGSMKQTLRFARERTVLWWSSASAARCPHVSCFVMGDAATGHDAYTILGSLPFT